MESPVRDKMEEQGTSNIDVAGSDNSTLVVDTRGKRKTDPLDGSSLKRICAPSQDSTSDDIEDHSPFQVNDGGVVPDSGKGESHAVTFYSNPAEAAMADHHNYMRLRRKPWPERKPTPEEWDHYHKQLAATQGFDVDDCFRVQLSFPSAICPSVGPITRSSYKKDYQHLIDLAGKHVYSVSQVRLTDLQLVKRNRQGSGRAIYYYITFIAKGSSDNVVRCYQAKLCSLIHRQPNTHWKRSVEFVRLRDERGHLTDEDFRKLQPYNDEDSLAKLYMDEFCPIDPASKDLKEIVYSEMYKYYIQLAAVKASEDLDLGGKKLQNLKTVDVYYQLFGFTKHNYITFEGCLDGERRLYGAKITETFYDDESKPYCLKVESVWQEDPSNPTVKALIEQRKEKEAKKCFDSLNHQTPHMKNISGVLTSVDAETIKGDEEYEKFKAKIVAAAAKTSGGEKKLKDLEIEKANEQSFGCTKHHYITFTAKDGEGRRRYRAKLVTRRPYVYESSESDDEAESECDNDEGENECDDDEGESGSDDEGESESDDEDEWTRVEFVSQKDDDGGQVTIE